MANNLHSPHLQLVAAGLTKTLGEQPDNSGRTKDTTGTQTGKQNRAALLFKYK